jgi:uncharacterized protein (DUF2141 family)
MSCTLIVAILSATVTYHGSTVLIEASGFSTPDGEAVLAIFRSDSWPAPSDLSGADSVVTCRIVNSCIHAEITGLAHSSYVILAFHDIDCDSRLDSDEEIAIPQVRGWCPEIGRPPSFDDISFMNKTLVTEVVLVVIRPWEGGARCMPS